MSNAQITLQEFHQLHAGLPDKEVILDVRRPEEFREAHIPGARNIPVDQVAQHVDELRGYSRVYLHCKRGGRAKTAFEILSAAGLGNLVCVQDGGMDQWLEKGFPSVKG